MLASSEMILISSLGSGSINLFIPCLRGQRSCQDWGLAALVKRLLFSRYPESYSCASTDHCNIDHVFINEHTFTEDLCMQQGPYWTAEIEMWKRHNVFILAYILEQWFPYFWTSHTSTIARKITGRSVFLFCWYKDTENHHLLSSSFHKRIF